jgi:hypothetical protein
VCRCPGPRADRFGGDISLPLLGIDRRLEVKGRAKGFARLYDWLDGADMMVVKADRKEPLVVIPLRLAADIALATEQGRGTTLNRDGKGDGWGGG